MHHESAVNLLYIYVYLAWIVNKICTCCGLTGDPVSPGAPGMSEVQVHAYGKAGQLSSSLCRSQKDGVMHINNIKLAIILTEKHTTGTLFGDQT